MWSRFDLKVRLTLQVAAVLALCFAAISAYFLVEADKALRARLDTVAAIAAKTLELQKSKMLWINSPRSDFPDLHLVAPFVMTPGAPGIRPDAPHPAGPCATRVVLPG